MKNSYRLGVRMFLWTYDLTFLSCPDCVFGWLLYTLRNVLVNCPCAFSTRLGAVLSVVCSCCLQRRLWCGQLAGVPRKRFGHTGRQEAVVYPVVPHSHSTCVLRSPTPFIQSEKQCTVSVTCWSIVAFAERLCSYCRVSVTDFQKPPLLSEKGQALVTTLFCFTLYFPFPVLLCFLSCSSLGPTDGISGLLSWCM